MDITKSKSLSEMIVKYEPKIKASERGKISCSNDSYCIFKNVWDSMEHI